MLCERRGVSQAFLERWYVCSGYMDVSENGSIYDCGNICLDPVSLAYLVENLSARVEFLLRLTGMNVNGWASDVTP